MLLTYSILFITDMHVVQNYKLVADCRSRAINETTPVSQIIQEEIEKYIALHNASI
jgi:hypothetical protein